MKKLSRHVATGAVVVGMLAAAVLSPVVLSFAAWADATTLTFNFNVTGVSEAPAVNLAAFDSNYQPLATGEYGVGLWATVEGYDGIFGFNPVDSSKGYEADVDSSRITTHCGSTESCSMQISGVDTTNPAYQIKIMTPGGTPLSLYLNSNNSEYHGELLNDSDGFTIAYSEEYISRFDGDAYAIWACGENDAEVCLHLITGIENENGEMEYYSAAGITDITNPSRVFDQFGFIEDEDRTRGMALKADAEDWVKEYLHDEDVTVTDVDWSEVDIRQFLRGTSKGDYEFQLISDGICSADVSEDELHACVDQYFDDNGLSETRGVKLQPLSDESQGEHSYMSFGDRNFKIVIYEEGYKAIQLGDTSDMYYLPYTMTDDVYVSSIDISGTTAENPAHMDLLLLEDTITFDALTEGGLNIASVVALDVPEGAVSVSGTGGSYTIHFNSNFYDAVVFEITDVSGEKYYLQVDRSLLYVDVNDAFYGGSSVYVKFFFDAESDYDDYEILATYVYDDGSMEIKTMQNRGSILCNLSDQCAGYQMEGGRNLKMADYEIEESLGFTENMTGVYFNVRRVGSTDNVYAGTLSGSGIGYYEEIRHRGEH